MDALYEDIEDPFFRQENSCLESDEATPEALPAVDKELGEVKEQNSKLQQQNVALKKNISCLYKTARLEIERKENAIKELLGKVASLENELQVGAQVIFQQYLANCYGNLQPLGPVVFPELKPAVGELGQAAIPFPASTESHIGTISGPPQQQQQLTGLDLSHLAANPDYVRSVAGQNEFASIAVASHGDTCDTNCSSLASSLSGSSLAGTLGLLQSHPEVGGVAGSACVNGRNARVSDESVEFDSEDSTTWEFNECSSAGNSKGQPVPSHPTLSLSSQHLNSKQEGNGPKLGSQLLSKAGASTKQQVDVRQKHRRNTRESRRSKDMLSHGRSHCKSQESGQTKRRSRRPGHACHTSSDQNQRTCEDASGRSHSRYSRSTSTEPSEIGSHCSRRTPKTSSHDSKSRLHRSSKSPFSASGVVGNVNDADEVKGKLIGSYSKSHRGSKESTPSSPHKNHSAATANSLSEPAGLVQSGTNETVQPCAGNGTVHPDSKETTPSSSVGKLSAEALKSPNKQACSRPCGAASGDAVESINCASEGSTLRTSGSCCDVAPSSRQESVTPVFSGQSELAPSNSTCNNDRSQVPLQSAPCEQSTLISATKTCPEAHLDVLVEMTPTPVPASKMLSSASTKQLNELTPDAHVSDSTSDTQLSESTPRPQFSKLIPSTLRESTPDTHQSDLTPDAQFSESTPDVQLSELTPVSQFSELTPTTARSSSSTPVAHSHELTPVPQFCDSDTFELMPAIQSTTDTQFREATPGSQTSELTLASNFSETTPSTKFDKSSISRTGILDNVANAELPVQQESAASGLNVGVASSEPAGHQSSRSHGSSSRSLCSDGRRSRKGSNSKSEASGRSDRTDRTRSREKGHHSKLLLREDSSKSGKLSSSRVRDREGVSKNKEDRLKSHPKGTKSNLSHKGVSDSDKLNFHDKTPSILHRKESAILPDLPNSSSQSRKSHSRSQSESDSRLLHGEATSKSNRSDPHSRSRRSSTSRHNEGSQKTTSSSKTKSDRSRLLSTTSRSASKRDNSESKSELDKASSRMQVNEHGSRVHCSESRSRLQHPPCSKGSPPLHHSKSTPESRSRHRHDRPASHRRTTSSLHHHTSSPHDRHELASHRHHTSRFHSRTNSLHLDRLQIASSGSRRRSLQEDSRHLPPQKHHIDHTSGLSPHSKRLRKDLQCRHSTPDSLKEGEGSETPSLPRSRCDDELSLATLGSLNNLILFEEEGSQTDSNQLADDDRESLESGELLSDCDDLESGELLSECGDLNSMSSLSPVKLNSSNNCNGNDHEKSVLTKVQECNVLAVGPQTPPPPPPPAATVAEEAERLDYSCFNFSSSDISLSESSDTQTSSSNSSCQNQSICTVLSRTISEEVGTESAKALLSGIRYYDEPASTSTLALDLPPVQADSPSMYLNSPEKCQQIGNAGSSEVDINSISCDLDLSEHFDAKMDSHQASQEPMDCDMPVQLQETASSQVTATPICTGMRASTPCEDHQLQPNSVLLAEEMAPLNTSALDNMGEVVSQSSSRAKSLNHCEQYPHESAQIEDSLQKSIVIQSRHFESPLSPKPIDSGIVFSDSAQWISPSVSSCDDQPVCLDSAKSKCISPSHATGTSCSPLLKGSSGPPSAEVTILDTSNNYTNCVDVQLLDTANYVFLSPMPASTTTQDSSSSSEDNSSNESMEEGEISDSSDSSDENEENSQTDSLFGGEDKLHEIKKMHSPTSKKDHRSPKHEPLTDCSNSDLENNRFHVHKMRRYSMPERTRTRERGIYTKKCSSRTRHHVGRSHEHHHYHRSHEHHHYHRSHSHRHADRSRVKVK